nr:MAG TPA: hypothetical protein [Caudoviricetes sp.]
MKLAFIASIAAGIPKALLVPANSYILALAQPVADS